MALEHVPEGDSYMTRPGFARMMFDVIWQTKPVAFIYPACR